MSDYISILKGIRKNHELNPEPDPNSKILIIDGMNLFIRIFSAVPSVNDDGAHIGGLSGFLRSLAYSIKLHDPTRCIVVFDGKGGSTRRRKLYPDYKKKSKPHVRFNRLNDMSPDEERYSQAIQLARCAEYLECLPITTISIDNIEADDTIAYISKSGLPESKIIIMSTDQDFLQLVDDRISVWSPKKKKLYTPSLVKEDYNKIPVSNFLVYKILIGDQSDNIPGVKGIQMTTLLKRFPEMLDDNVTIKQLFNTAEKNKDKYKVYQSLLESKNQLKLNYQLMQLYDVSIPNSLKLQILNRINESISYLDKSAFHLLFLNDRLWSVIPDLDGWLSQSFYRLNSFAEKYNNG